MLPLTAVSGVAQCQRLVRTAFVGFQQSEHLPEYLSRISPVDLFDHDHMISCRLVRGILDRVQERSVQQLERAVAAGPPASHEVLIGQIRVELQRANPCWRPNSDEGERELLRQPGLAGAGRPLKDQVLFDPPSNQDRFQPGPIQEATLCDDVIH